jgi:hypothetical protein
MGADGASWASMAWPAKAREFDLKGSEKTGRQCDPQNHDIGNLFGPRDSLGVSRDEVTKEDWKQDSRLDMWL